MNAASSPSVEIQLATDEADLPSSAEVARWVRAAADAGYRETPDLGSITVRFVGREEIAALNRTYRGQTGATNVLAFPSSAPPVPIPDREREVGDVVICVPLSYQEAADRNTPATAHLAHLVVHGTLHLLGFEHDEERSAEQMESLETRVLQQLGFSDPYCEQ
jgi:probable rRNA maturation factor